MMAEDSVTPSSPPLPKKGAYSIDFDALDDSINPFASNKTLGNSPPIKAAPPIDFNNLDDLEDPFKTRTALSNSPPMALREKSQPPDDAFEDIENPFKSKSKISSSPPGSPKVIHQNDKSDAVGFDPGMTGGESIKASVDIDHTPRADNTPVEDQNKQDDSAKKKKVVKKSKIQSKFRPPKNFKKQQEDFGDIQIFMPGISDDKLETQMSAQTEERPADILEQSLKDKISSLDPVSNLPDVVTDNEDVRKTSVESELVEDFPKIAASDALASSLDSDQPFMERGQSEEPEQANNEGFAVPHEVMPGSGEMMDLMDTSELKEKKSSKAADSSLLSKFDPLIEKTSGKSSRSSTSSPKEHGNSPKRDNEALRSSPIAQHPEGSKHPASRVLEAGVTDNNIKKSSTMENVAVGQDDNVKGQVVQLVQVLRYSQSDWNKMKQELELNFQTSLLNKERDWSLLLGDRDKKLSALEDTNRKLKHTNEDMRMVVAEFEKTISQLQAEKEKTRTDSSNSLQKVEHERDQALEDLSSVETAFSDLHRRYEKSKTIIEGFKRNEEQLKNCVADLQEKVKRSDAKLQSLRAQAEEKLDRANEDIEKVTKSSKQDIVRLEAAVKKADLRISSLEESLQRKEKENQELTAICDELISKVGS